MGPWLGLTLGAVLLGAAALWRLRQSGWGLGDGFLIRSRGGAATIEVRGLVPRSKVLEIQEFCRRDLRVQGPFSIRGRWGPGGRLELRWTGRSSPAQRQQARNYLLDCLK